MKKCSICGSVKRSFEYYKNCRSNDGMQAHCKVCHEEIARKWMKKNPEAKRKYGREAMTRWRSRNPEKVKVLREKYWSLYGNKYKAAARERERLKREGIIKHYGGMCACCQESNFRFLCLDHKNNDGYSHRKKRINIHDFIIKNGFPLSFQVLCFNCNFARAFYGGKEKICPHKMK